MHACNGDMGELKSGGYHRVRVEPQPRRPAVFAVKRMRLRRLSALIVLNIGVGIGSSSRILNPTNTINRIILDDVVGGAIPVAPVVNALGRGCSRLREEDD